MNLQKKVTAAALTGLVACNSSQPGGNGSSQADTASVSVAVDDTAINVAGTFAGANFSKEYVHSVARFVYVWVGLFFNGWPELERR